MTNNYPRDCIVGPEWALQTTLVRKTTERIGELHEGATGVQPGTPQGATKRCGDGKRSFFSQLFETVSGGLDEESEQTIAQKEAHHAAISKEALMHDIHNDVQDEVRRVCHDHNSFMEFKQALKDTKTTPNTVMSPEMYMRKLAYRRTDSLDSQSLLKKSTH